MKRFLLSILLFLAVLVGVSAQERVSNPMLWADVPDPDIIQVDGTFYLVSTTMHLMPGAPIMRSRDLKNWETVSYVYDRLTDSPKYDLSPTEGTVYGRGQWATSLKYHQGKFYVLFAPNEQGPMGDTYIYSADRAEGPWTLVSRMRHFHDCSLFFDDDDRVYVVYGTGELMELKKDLSDVIEGTHQKIFEREADETGLLEGSRMIKHNGKYYLQMISQVYAPGRHRREVCYRADDIHGPYEKKVILESDFGGFPYVGQGTIVDTPEGDWYAVIFQDRGGVGRVPTLSPVRWIDGWPMIGDEEGKVPESLRAYRNGEPTTGIVLADDFSAKTLGLQWQWNHNPMDAAWSLTDRPGWLRLKTSRVVNTLYLAPNTLTQRMYGPTCCGIVALDISHMKDGDCAGLAAFNDQSGVLTIKRQGKKYVLEMSEQSVQLTDREKKVTDATENVVESVNLNIKSRQLVYLRIDADFRPNGRGGGNDLATFYYSIDGQEWTKIGSDYRLRFDWRRFFMGSKFGIFSYATKQTGGWVDVDAFRLSAYQTWTKGGFETGQYRNLFVEMGHQPAEVEAKLKEVFNDVFRGPNKVYFEVGDTLGYVSDIKNHDARTEGMSYGMMIAVQMGEKDIFDRLWRWSKKYMQHQDGPRKGYFAWSCKTDGTRNAEGAASDGELYFITSLLFASNRWGNDTGINYKAEAQHILNCIQPRVDDSPQPAFPGGGRRPGQEQGPQGRRMMYLIDPDTKLITFTPDGFGQRFTDPSYHIPAFYEVWAEYADDGRSDYWRDCAAKSRAYLHRATDPVTGLNPDMSNFDGSLLAGWGGRRNGGSNFRYDSWRVPMNIALDYEWSCADREWQQRYGERIQNFFYSQGVNDFVDQYRVDGSQPADDEILQAGGFKKLRHSIGLVATTAAASVMCGHAKSREFVEALWNARHEPFEDGYFDAYYDGLLRLFAFMHLSGHYQVIVPK